MRAKDARLLSVFLFELKTSSLLLEKYHEVLDVNDPVADLIYGTSIKQFVATLYRVRDLERSGFLDNKIKLGVYKGDLDRISEIRNTLLHGSFDIDYNTVTTSLEIFQISNRVSHNIYKQLPPDVKVSLDKDIEILKKEIDEGFYKYFKRKGEKNG